MPAHATYSRSGFAFFACCANGVKSFAEAGTRIDETVWPRVPNTLRTAATLPWPNAVSWANTVILRPTPRPRISFAASVSW